MPLPKQFNMVRRATTLFMLALLLLGSTQPAQGQGNPFDSAAQSVATDERVGVFANEQCAIEIRRDADGYAGRIALGDVTMPFRASATTDGLAGTFESNGAQYDFTVRLQGDSLEFRSGNSAHMLTRIEREQPAAEDGLQPRDGRPIAYIIGAYLSNGDAEGTMVVRYTPDDYKRLREMTTGPEDIMRDFMSDRADFELDPRSTAEFDDSKQALVVHFLEHGSAKNLGSSVWEVKFTKDLIFDAMTEGDPASIRAVRASPDFIEWHEYTLPADSHGAEWDPHARAVRYRLQQSFTGHGRLGSRFDARDRLMSCTYKVNGLRTDFAAQWVAKCVFRNTGDGLLSDLRVRFRLQGYTEWSQWERFPELVPTQTAVSVYYPVIDRSIVDITSNTPANVLVEWEYTDSAGERHEDSDSERIVLLGRHEFIMSHRRAYDVRRDHEMASFFDIYGNAPLLAAWVSRDDPVIREFGGMANKLAGGIGAGSSDEATVQILQAAFELMRSNGITYQHPPSLADRSVGFDPQRTQNVKFPRDVLREKSGTCIDLAIIYAATSNTVGIKPYLAVVPGHCFPVFELPKSRNLIGVEATMIHGDASFLDALNTGNDTLKKCAEDGRIFLVDIRELWTKGVSNPELEPLPADILQRWGITLDQSRSTTTTKRSVAGTWQDQSDGTVFALDRSHWAMYAQGQLVDGGAYVLEGDVITMQSQYTDARVQFRIRWVDAGTLHVTDAAGETSTLLKVD